jgi:hypothetical protein
MMTADERRIARKLRARADAVNGASWFALAGDGRYPGIDLDGTAASMGARAAGLGRVAPAVAAALFAPIEPTHVIQVISAAWAATEPAALLAAREQAVVAWLEQVIAADADAAAIDIAALNEQLGVALGSAPAAGHPVFAGIQALPLPANPIARLHRLCEMVRERRGDSHRNAWSSRGLDAVELCILTELWRGGALFSITCTTMGWPHDAAAHALGALRERGLVEPGAHELTVEGRTLRDAIEDATDDGEHDWLGPLGATADEIVRALDPIARAAVAAGSWRP